MSNAAQIELGSVVSLWRYPVKSMVGGELNATEVTERGLLGDRAYALVDTSDGKAATAKNPRKWPRLGALRAIPVEPTSPAAKASALRIASGGKGFAENAWVGHGLAIGTAVRLNITGPCGRCVMTTLAQGDLSRDPGILRTAAQHNQVNVGVYAAVVRGGTIRRGDPVRLE